MSKVFIDTNVLVYSMDARYPAKRDHARRKLDALPDDAGVISTQVLEEAYVTFTRKLGMAPLEAKASVSLLTAFEVVTVDADLVLKAIDCAILDTLSLWDALIVAAAASANCEKVWTEDMNDGQVILGVRIVNPFAHLEEPSGEES
ncbi:MAG: PIN domain-containing protein [Planctomycetota bacterium]